jgi:hypothetical protein
MSTMRQRSIHNSQIVNQFLIHNSSFIIFSPIPRQHLLGVAARIADHDAIPSSARVAYIAAATGADLQFIDGLLA